MTEVDTIPANLWPVAAAIVLIALLCGVLAALLASRWFDRLRRVHRAQRALRGEARAQRLLERDGFAIEGAQVEHDYIYTCDGTPLRARIRADYIVLRGRRRYVAEVKTGSVVTSLQHAPTRRQLLEYQYAFGTDGVLFVDAEAQQIHRVEF